VRLTPESDSPAESVEPLLGVCRLTMARTLGGTDDFGEVAEIIEIDEDVLLVVDPLAPPFLKVLDRTSGLVVHAFGNRGEGPEEFQAPNSVYPLASQAGTVGVYDFFNQRISFVRPGNFDTPPTVERELPLRVGVGLIGLEPYGDGYVGLGRFLHHTLVVLNETGESIARLVTDPPHTAENTGGPAGLAALMNDSRLDGRDGRVVVAYRNLSALDLIDLDGRTYKRVMGPRPAQARFEIRDGGILIDDEHELAYITVVATERFVFGVFDGNTRATRREAGPGGGTSLLIHVFDWDGRYLLELELERGITTLEVSSDYRRIWTGLADPVPLVAEWMLPPIVELVDQVDSGARAEDLDLCSSN